jgi:hypothetical protein
MTRTAIVVGAAALALLYVMPAQAQVTRVFVSGNGNDSNPCTYAAPCRTFQQAFNVAPANSEIDVLAGYGWLTSTHGISIQGHGYASITEASLPATAITINAGASDVITLNGLILDGGQRGYEGIAINTAGSVQILNCVIRHFSQSGIDFLPSNGAGNLLVSDTVVSDNYTYGIRLNNMQSLPRDTPVMLSGIIREQQRLPRAFLVPSAAVKPWRS